MKQEPQRCPECNRFLKRITAVEPSDYTLQRILEKFSNAGGAHYSCTSCKGQYTIYETSVVLSEDAA